MKLKQSREAFISAITALHQDKKSAPIFTAFLAEYYADLPLEDFALRDASEWYGAAQAHWRLAEKRAAKEEIIRVYNPTFDEYGWQSGYTVVEIVHDNIPFLVDTVNITLNYLGYNGQLLIHPIFRVTRGQHGEIQQLNHPDGLAESWMHIEFDRENDPAQLQKIKLEIQNALTQLAAAVEDWPKMISAVQQEIDKLTTHPPALAPAEIHESQAFLNWLLADNFVLLGCRDYQLLQQENEENLVVIPNSGLGLLRDAGKVTASRSFAALPDELRQLAHTKSLLVLTKSNSRARIHRAAHLDIVIIKQFNESGEVIGERRITGLYTANAYNATNRQVPILRSKIAEVLALTQVDVTGHKGKKLLNILDTFPRDELIEISTPELARIAVGIVSLQDRKQIRVFVREDVYRRYVSVMLFMPKDNYNTDVRIHIQKILLNTFKGSSAEFSVHLSDAVLARVHFIVRIESHEALEYSAEDIEAQITLAARRWQDELYSQLLQHAGDTRGARLYSRYQQAFSASYCADFTAHTAVYDIDKLEKSLETNQLQMILTPASISDPCHYRLRLYHHTPIDLSDSLPILDNMGVRIIEERPYNIHFADKSQGWISDIGIRIPVEGVLDNETFRHNFQEGFLAIFSGQVENDSLNKLILLANLTWREAMLIRAYTLYIKQLGIIYDQLIATDLLSKHAHIVNLLVRFILAKHRPDTTQSEEAADLLPTIDQAINQITGQDEERLLSGLWEAIQATVRINYFQQNAAQQKDYLSFKVASHHISYMPQPVPLFEIFVYSPRVEGIHLRGGKVARGGLRWSDRREDFRTEVLGLVKAQMVKNAVIVPVGSKGGFVCKQIPLTADRATTQAEGIACYRIFISGLLDLTDNIIEGNIVSPPQVVRLDEDDPYLVVAADKGTASFSDIANEMSQHYHFWLDDAFASGGSVGYDHKKMAITARGAWESAKRQFRELGRDIQTEPFTVIGIGDMSGDVFGNGMLRSACTLLVGAFNHQHIFLDPHPDPELSFKERQRLFDLPQSSWEDYDSKLISQGGGIFSRHARHIPLSQEVQALLGVDDTQMEPNALIHALLQAPVDLIYNGGIGTYIKASTQSHNEVNDKTNDAVRVNGNEVRAKVIVEGGNLGMSQLGRIEYALQQGHVYTDAIDNSAGVDCSDHEVNIKILLGMLVQNGDMTVKQRNTLLASMTDDVALLVLRDNYLQTQAISLEATQAVSLSSVHRRFISYLEKTGKLSRRIEYLPDEKQLNDRLQLQLGLTKPEISVLLAYAKMDLYEHVLNSDLPDSPMWDPLLADYFPTAISKKFAAYLPQHSLRREIIATTLTNRIINRMGTTFIFRVEEEMETDTATVIYAWYQAAQALNCERLFSDIEALDNRVDAQTQYAMLLEVRRQLERVTRWILHLALTGQDVHALFEALRAHLPTQLSLVARWLKDSVRHQTLVQQWVQAGVPEKQARLIACLDAVIALLNAARIAEQYHHPLDDVTKLYFKLAQIVRLDWLTGLIDALPRHNRWQTLARSACRYDLYQGHSKLVERVLCNGKGESADRRLESWLTANEAGIEHYHRLFEELEQSVPDLAMISAAIREITQRLGHAA
jgi:glutamate dehydrogenase